MGLLIYALISKLIRKYYDVPINKQVFFILLLIEITAIYKKDLLFYILFTLLLVMSITDVINNDVNTLICIIIGILGLIFNKDISIMSFLVPVVLYIVNKFIKGMGLGDIYLLIALSFIFNTYEISLICLLSSTMNLIYSRFIKKERYAFVPFISLASLIMYLFFY